MLTSRYRLFLSIAVGVLTLEHLILNFLITPLNKLINRSISIDESKIKYEYSLAPESIMSSSDFIPDISESVTENKNLQAKKYEAVQVRSNAEKQILQNNEKEIIPLAFQDWNGSYPCYFDSQQRRNKGGNLRGLIFIKCQKTASTTVSSIVQRIVRVKSPEERHCSSWWEHEMAWKKQVSLRNEEKTFLFSFVRNPARRYLSEFFYSKVSKLNWEVSLASFLQELDFRGNNYQLRYLSPVEVGTPMNQSISTSISKLIVQDILTRYNFVGLVERFDESIVALRLLLGLDATDVLYMPSNVQGSFAVYNLTCIKIQKAEKVPAIEEYLSSNEFLELNEGDFILYDAVNKSLDLTIERLGKERFQKALKEHEWLMSLVKERCSNQVRSICPREGPRQLEENNNCYVRDYGCGYDCLDELSFNFTGKEPYWLKHNISLSLTASLQENPLPNQANIQNKAWKKLKDETPEYETDKFTKSYQNWKGPFPCVTDHPKGNLGVRGGRLRGLIYIKCQKTASTTVSSIVQRISKIKSKEEKDCAAWWEHKMAWEKGIFRRNKYKTFLLSFVRDPAKRYLSEFFFSRVSKLNWNVTLESFSKELLTRGNNYQLRYLSPRSIRISKNEAVSNKIVSQKVREILSAYDFVGLAERFDESIVTLRLLLGLDATDVIYIPTNFQGSFAVYNFTCIKIQKTRMIPSIKSYLDSDEFLHTNAGDYMLYDAVNKSLDLTIERLGKERFQKALSIHQWLMSLVKKNCFDQVKHICPKEGPRQIENNNNCYERGYACGYDCLDRLTLEISKRKAASRLKAHT